MNMPRNRHELISLNNFIDSLSIDIVEKRKSNLELFNHWKENGTDSPWNIDYDRINLEKNAVKTLISISEHGISNQWCGEHIIFDDIKKNNHNYNLRKRS